MRRIPLWPWLLLAILLLVGLWVTTIPTHYSGRYVVLCGEGSEAACNDRVQVSTAFSWSTLSSNVTIRGRFAGLTHILLETEGRLLADNLTVYTYRSTGLLGTTLRLIERSATTSVVTHAADLLGTTPGFLSHYFTAQSDKQPDKQPGAGATSWVEVEIEGSRGDGTIELVPIRSARFFVTQQAWQLGWLIPFAGLSGGLYIALLLVPGYRSALSARLASVVLSNRRRGGVWARLPVLLPLLLALLLLPWVVGALLLIGWTAWGWFPLATLSHMLPAAVNPVWLSAPLSEIAASIWPDSWIKHTVSATSADGFFNALSTVSDRVPVNVWGLLVGLVILSLSFALVRKSAPVEPAALAVLALSMTCLVLYPAWHMPTSLVNQRWIAVGLVLLLFVHFLLLNRIAPQPASATRGTTCALDRRDWQIALGIAGLFFAVHAHTAWGPLTYHTDETTYLEFLYFPYQFFGISLSGSFWDRTWPYVGLLCALGAVAYGVWRQVRQGRLWIVLVVALVAIIGLLLIRPEIEAGIPYLFRFPPLFKFFAVALLWPFGPSWEGARLVVLLFAALGGGGLYLLGRTAQFSRGVALTGAAAYLGSGTIYYWSGFTYNSLYMVFFLVGALIVLCRWIVSSDPKYLLWLTLFGIAAHYCRLTGFVVFAVCVIAIPMVMLASAAHRSTQAWRAYGFFCVGSLLPFLLWQKWLVGSWYQPVGVGINWQQLLRFVDQPERWDLVAWSFLNSNGSLLYAMTGVGLLCAVWSKRYRLISIPIGLLFLLVPMISLLMNRGSGIYDGYTRFMIEFMPVTAFAVMVLAATASRLLWRKEWLVCGAILGGLFFQTSYRADPQTCVMPTDLNQATQYHGVTMGLIPEAQILASLPDDVDPRRVYLVNPANMRLRVLKQLSTNALQNEKTIYQQAMGRGASHVVFLDAEEPACRERDWFFSRHGGSTEARIIDDPTVLAKSALFNVVDTAPFPPFRVVRLQVVPPQQACQDPLRPRMGLRCDLNRSVGPSMEPAGSERE